MYFNINILEKDRENRMFVIRADGGSEIGMGHLVRTSVLAKEISKYTDICYVCNIKYREGIELLRNKGFKVIESKNVLETLMNLNAKGILTDHYSLNEEYIKKVYQKFNLVGYIDDNVAYQYKADFILNQNFGAENLNYDTLSKCKFFLGTQYLLVREEFRNLAPIKIKNHAKRIFLTVGGSDTLNETKKLLLMIKDIPNEIEVVIGPIFPYQQEVIKEFKKYKNIKFHKCPNMGELAMQCDMAISSCGSTLYELGLLGIPTVGIVNADNQYELAKRMSEVNMIKYIGRIEEIEANILKEVVLQLANNKEERMKLQIQNQIVLNANGVQEIAKYIEDRLKG